MSFSNGRKYLSSIYTSCSSFVELTRVRTYIELDHLLVNLWATVVLQSFGEHTNVLFATHCACKQDRTLKTPCERSGPHKKKYSFLRLSHDCKLGCSASFLVVLLVWIG